MADRFPDQGDETIRLLAEAQAGLWLSESLILALVGARILDKERVIEAIEIVTAAKQAMAAEGRSPELSRAAAALLASISTSIAAARTDAAGTPGGTKRGRRTQRSGPA